jgi:hypothetical protein
MVEGDGGKDLLIGFYSSFNKFSGIGRPHCHYPEIEKDFHKGMTGRFMLHYQYNAVGTDDALHLLQGSLSRRHLQLIQGMGTGDDIKTLINKRKGSCVSFYQDDRPDT